MQVKALIFYLMHNMFQMLKRSSSAVCDIFVEFFMGCVLLVRCVLVLLCGLAGVVWYPVAR